MTPTTTTLVEAADVDAWQRVLGALCRDGDGGRASQRVLLVPSRQAGEQFRRTLEHRVLIEDEGVPEALAAVLGMIAIAPGRTHALVAPRTLTRGEWYEHLAGTAAHDLHVVTLMASEVLMAAAARARVEAGDVAPFLVRPGLVAEMVQLHAALHRLGHSLEGAAARLLPDLEADAPSDRGASRLLAQTRFLWAVFADYDRRLVEAGLRDERAVRDACAGTATRFAGAHVIVAVADHHAADQGLWPADFALLTSLPLARLDVVYTAREGQAGLERRLRTQLPQARRVAVPAQRASTTRLETPGDAQLWFTCRDREEEVLRFARRVKASPATAPASTGLVYRRPLPYLYLAQQVLESAGIPFETRETLPLAAEPWAAALDVLMDSVLADHTRATLVALLRHPLFKVADEGGSAVDPAAVLAFDRLLARDRYLGGASRLAGVVARWRDGQTSGHRRDLPQALAVATVAEGLVARLAPLHALAPAHEHLRVLGEVFGALASPTVGTDAGASRARRVSGALRLVLDGLREACEAHDQRPVRARDVFAVLRRWIEGRTFAPLRDGDGIQVLDLDAARFGRFERVRLVGLVDGEWPEPSARNVFYPAFLLARLGWAEERARAAATRAAFADLLTLPSDTVGVSVPELEQDAVVRPSALLDELAAFGIGRRCFVPADERDAVVTGETALLASPLPLAALDRTPAARRWLDWRLARGPVASAGTTGPLGERRHSVTAVERYQQCPFQYFAAAVLALEEEPEDEAGLPSRDAGVFVHDVLQACYAAWQARGEVPIRVADLPEARAVFAEVAERSLARLAPADRVLERLRLFGSAVSTGLLEKVLRVEIEAFGDVVERRLEVTVDGHVTVATTDGEPKRVALSGRVDRVDRTAGGGIRVVDYKSGRRPQQAGLQPAVYALALLEGAAGVRPEAHVAPSGYVALREVSPWVATVKDTASAREAGQAFGDAVTAIEAGVFPVRPVNVFRCRFCDFGSVCRKDYVGDE